MSDAELISEVVAFLRRRPTASLATVDEAGHPHAANVQFALAAELRLIFVSSLRSAHSMHIAADPWVALTIYAEVDGPRQIHGVQLHGRCEAVAEPLKGIAWDVYVNRFPFITTNPALEARARAEQLYEVRPTWLRWIDNRRGFGFKREMRLGV